MTQKVSASDGTPRDTLGQLWDERYATCSLEEAFCFGAGAGLTRMIARAKKQALRRGLRLAGLGPQSPFRVLDMACGFGYFGGFYREEYPRATYVGVDISARAIEHAHQTMPDREFFAADVVAWRHPAEMRFDVIQAIDVLQLLTDDAAFEAAVQNLERHLAPGGAMLLPLMFADQPPPALHHKIRSRAYFDALLTRQGLTVTAEFPMYYWLVDGGSPNRIMRAIFARLGAGALYAVDRLALTLGLENRHPEHVLSRARMLVVMRAGAAANGPRNRGSES
jgi:SAM-dependent methyltransferase